MNREVVYDSANQSTLQCALIDTSDDDIVELSDSFTLQLLLNIVNERITIRPEINTVTLEDNDSTFQIN